jgi:hypothetical protein
MQTIQSASRQLSATRIEAVPHTATSQRPPRSFLDDLQIRYGDVGVLGRYFLQAETQLADQGLTLTLVTADELMAVFDANRDTWDSIGPQFNPRESHFVEDAVANFVAVTAAGDPVATCSVRYFDLGHETLTTAAARLYFIYGDNAARYRDRQHCHVTPAAGDHLSGRMLFSGAQWLHPRVRGSGLAQQMVLIPRAYGLSQWQFDHELLLAKPSAARPQILASYGMPNATDGIEVTIDGQSAYHGMVFWSTSAHLATVVEAAVTSQPVQVSDDGRHQQHVAAAT